MPVLSNAKWERFAQELAKGKSADEAYQLAGYKPNRGNAATLKANQNVADRVAEILERGAKRAEVTIESLTEMLREDRALARELGQAAAAVSAVDKIAKLYGHMIDRKEVGRPGDFSRMTEEELDEFIASRKNIAGRGDSRKATAAHSEGMPGKSSRVH
jgi:phage terminase small subunit